MVKIVLYRETEIESNKDKKDWFDYKTSNPNWHSLLKLNH